MCVLFGATILLSAFLATVLCECDKDVEANATAFLKEFDTWIKMHSVIQQRASWDYSTNLTDYNKERMLNETRIFWDGAAVEAEKGTNITQDDLCSNDTLAELKEVLQYRKTKKDTKEVEDIYNRMSVVEAQMESIYSKAKVCMDKGDGKNTCLQMEPGLTILMADCRNEKVLRTAWTGWRNKTGKVMREKYIEFVELNNEYVEKIYSGKIHDRGEIWRGRYNWKHPEKFEQDVKSLLKQVMPLYQQVHSFVRRRLETIYKNPTLFKSRLIPAHLLGNMWAQEWSTLQKDLRPFPDKRALDITKALKSQNYTVSDMFHEAEKFFVSLNLTKMTDEFWNNSMFVRPKDREVVCHGSAWDFGDGKDFRIKMCTTVTQEDFVTIHHEMGHIEYDMQYSPLPFVYHGAANPGFHEAVGDTLALSVATAKHLKTVGLLDKNFEEDSETDINYLMSMALDKIVFLPFAYVIDRWRWDVFSGVATPENYTKHWWDLRCKHQGIVPPELRTEDDFDPGSKYHVAANVAYIRYFVSFIIQFQFYEALCNETNHKGPLYKCDFYNNTAAGEKFSNMLKLGESKSWPDALEQLTGSREMDVGSLMRYFRPLIRYLKSVNGYFLDWEEDCKALMMPPPPTSPTSMPTPPTSPTSMPTPPTNATSPKTTTPGAANALHRPGVICVVMAIFIQMSYLWLW